MSEKIFLLSADPGQTNFAYALWCYEGGDNEPVLLETGMLPVTINDLTGETFAQQVDAFRGALIDILVAHGATRKNTEGATERFISRGMRSSTVSETIPIMIGVMSGLVCHMRLYQASTWKGYVNRALAKLGMVLLIQKGNKDDEGNPIIRNSQRGKRELYKEWRAASIVKADKKAGVKRFSGIPPHVIDAVLIGKHYFFDVYRVPLADSLNEFKQVLRDIRTAFYHPDL